MKKLINFIIILILIILISPITTYAIEFEEDINLYGGRGFDQYVGLSKDTDNSFVIVGGTRSTNIEGLIVQGENDGYILKYDSEGNLKWQKSYGGTKDEIYRSNTILKDKSIVAVGYSNSNTIADITSNKGLDNIIIRYDQYGNIIWIKNYGGSKDETNSISVTETTDGNIVVVGSTMSTDINNLVTNGTEDIFLLKYDLDGNIIWQTSISGNNEDRIYDILATDDGGVIIVGYTQSTNISEVTNKGGMDAILIKYDKDGNREWVKTYAGSGDEEFNFISKTSDGGYIVAADSSSTNITGLKNNGNVDSVIIKYDKDFNIEWQNNFGGSNIDVYENVIETQNGDFIAVGGTFSTNINDITNKGNMDGLVVCYDKNGNIKWNKNYGGTNFDYTSHIIELEKEQFIIIGYSQSTKIGDTTSNGSADSLIIKLSVQYEAETKDSENGTYTNTIENNKLKIIPTPKDGYEVDEIIITDQNGNKLSYYEEEGNYYSDLTDDVKVEVKFKERKLLDIINPATGDISSLIQLTIMIIVLLSTIFIIKRTNKSN